LGGIVQAWPARRRKRQAQGGKASPAPSSSSLVDEQLERYRAMRDFSKTAEPSGKSKTKLQAAAAKAGSLPFVIQKHAATRLHYDFRLGLHGVLKSWAVTKGPSYVPGDKRLAVQVEDHPMEYGGFEGTIPKGQYGGGTVMLWDEGTWEPLGDADESLGQRQSQVHSSRAQKLQGKWVLVRMGGKAANEAKPNWLLIKEHDEYEQTAQDEPIVEKAPNSVLTQRDIDAIARDGDHVWQSNRPETSQPGNKSFRQNNRLRPRLPRPELPGEKEGSAGVYSSPVGLGSACPPVGEHWVHELKLDGYRIQAHIDKSGKVRLFTRSGLDWTHRMPWLRAS
jgi:bifunctional non-homologous end joining protein LigD